MLDAIAPNIAHARRDQVSGGPYQVRCSHFVQVGVEFDETDVRSALPAGYTPASGMTGGFCVYRAENGWAITPYSAGFAWIDVDGLDSPAGARARCFIASWYSEKAGAAFSLPGSRLRIGVPYPLTSDGITTASAGGPEGMAFRISVRPNGAPPEARSGVHNYVDMAHDRRVARTVAFSHDGTSVDPVAVEILRDPPPPLRLLRPKRLAWGVQSLDMVLTLGMTTLIDAENAAHAKDAVTQVGLISRLGRAAILVGRMSELIFINSIAEGFIGDGLRLIAGRLLPAYREDEAGLRRLVLSASRPETDRLALSPVALRRPSGKNPLLIQAIPFPSGGAALGEATVDAVALLVTDPDRSVDRDPVEALIVLGLTRAEARIAAAVGAGLPPREVARRIGNTEATVRSTLNQVYGKLGIHRQSELARIVHRLETLGL